MSRLHMILGILVLIVFTIMAALLYVDYLGGGPCRAFRAISNDAAQNERLRRGLSDFVNDEANRRKLDGMPHRGFIMLNKYAFENPFTWLSVFEDYQDLEVLLMNNEFELTLRLEGGTGKFVPPYRISEIGVYGGRTLIMYRNENEVPYLGSEGADRLSQKSYVKCDVSFESGSPFE